MNFINGFDIISVFPFATLVAFGMLVLLLEVFQRESETRAYLSWVAALGFAVTIWVTIFLLKIPSGSAFGGTSTLDGYSGITTILFCLAGGLTVLAAPRWLQEHYVDRGEFYALVLFSTSGMVMMTSATDFIVFFVALEIMSIAAYALAAYSRWSSKSAESGMKYFILGAFASAIMLYGVALLYGATGSTTYVGISDALSGSGSTVANLSSRINEAIVAGVTGADVNVAQAGVSMNIATLGIILIMVAFAFKVAAAPLHMWAPDVYEGAPTPVVGFLAAGVKAASVLALFRILVLALGGESVRMGEFGWTQIVIAFAFLSMFIGNMVAIVQTSVKRMLAYSSVAHAGYLFVGIAAFGRTGDVSVGSGLVVYLVAYTFATVGAFAALAWLGKRGQECETYDDLNGLGYRHPGVGMALSIFMLSSAGIPPAVGFIGKFLVFKSAIDAAAQSESGGMTLILLVVAGVLLSVAGVYYYLRVIVHLYMKPQERDIEAAGISAAKVAIAACAAATLFFGAMPRMVTDSGERAIGDMVDAAALAADTREMDAEIEAFRESKLEERAADSRERVAPEGAADEGAE